MLQTRHSPIIVGDRYELVEALSHAGDNAGGLLAKSDFQPALLSMSGYDKHAASEMNDYGSRKPAHAYVSLADCNAGRTTTDGSYYTYTSGDFADSQAPAPSTILEGNPEPVLYDSSSSFQTRAIYSTTQSGFNEYGVRKAPEIESYSPIRGNKGTQLNVYLRSDYNLLADPSLIVSIAFGMHRVSASLTRLETTGSYYEFVATTIAPNFSETSSSNTSVHLQLQFQEQSGQEVGTLDVGFFQYIAGVLGSSPPTHEGSRKRKLSESDMSSIQRIGDQSFASSAGHAYTHSSQIGNADSMQRRYTPYGRTQNKFRDITSRRGSQDLSADSAASSLMRPPHSQSNAFGLSYAVVPSTGRTPGMDGSTTSSAPLIRTSTLQQSPGSSPAGSLGGSAFNPYPMYGQKAVLKLKGNLNSMADNWTPEEWTAKRRLVQFFRSRDGCTVNAQFAPVKPEDRQPSSITISCIWWEERQECFATSVDTIALLEQLVDNRFTVEEKNRIRRNLEGFKPLTVAKGKADSEEFFKVIMGFPNPKPRNIEKDVKVFEWKILAGALKKIMSKYSASHSSTAGPLHGSHTPIFSGYQSDPTTDRHARVSSRSASISTASSNYAQTLKSSIHSPNDALPSQYSEATTSAPLQNLGRSYVSPSLPSHFQPQDQINTSPPIGHLGSTYSDQTSFSDLPENSYPNASLERSRSYHDISDYNATGSNRFIKRPRANTSSSSSSLYHHQPENTASAYHQASRSFSEQPDQHRSGSITQLPSLSEDDYAVDVTTEGVYMPQPQAQPMQSSALVTAPTTRPYGY